MIGRYLSIPYVISAVVVPFMGYISDLIGKRHIMLLISSLLLLLSHLLWLTLKQCPSKYKPIINKINIYTQLYSIDVGDVCSPVLYLAPLIIIGFSYSIYTGVIYPCIAISLPEKYVGTGFGITSSMMQIGINLIAYLVNLFLKNHLSN